MGQKLVTILARSRGSRVPLSTLSFTHDPLYFRIWYFATIYRMFFVAKKDLFQQIRCSSHQSSTAEQQWYSKSIQTAPADVMVVLFCRFIVRLSARLVFKLITLDLIVTTLEWVMAHASDGSLAPSESDPLTALYLTVHTAADTAFERMFVDLI